MLRDGHQAISLELAAQNNSSSNDDKPIKHANTKLLNDLFRDATKMYYEVDGKINEVYSMHAKGRITDHGGRVNVRELTADHV